MLSNISGFPEFLPKEQIAFNKVVEIIKEQFELCGFSPLDTPVVERVSTLLAKGNDNEIYGIHRLAGEGSARDKDLALRFDLTVPLARYVAQHYSKLTFPYRRYHIAPVWRGERPQAGRYRQFYQCDIDIIGDNSLPLVYDAEVLSVAYEIFQAIGLKKFIIKINNRCILAGLIKSFGVAEEKVHNVMRTIDKIEKISPDALTAELDKQGIESASVVKIVDLINQHMSNNEWLEYLSSICTHTEMFTGIDELGKVCTAAQSFGITDSYLQIDPMLARGLGYYTGTVMEIKALDYPELGSVCGGGRYANLAATFSNKKLPGVGISIGISRLIPKLIASGVLQADTETPAVVLVTSQDSELMPEYIKITRILRKHNIYTELYTATKPLAAQMSYASKKGFKFATIASKTELEQGHIILRSLFDSKQKTTTLNQAIELIKQQSK